MRSIPIMSNTLYINMVSEIVVHFVPCKTMASNVLIIHFMSKSMWTPENHPHICFLNIAFQMWFPRRCCYIL